MTSISVQDWLANLAPDVQAITRQLRAIARKNMPQVQEFIHQDVLRFSVSDSPSDQFCYIVPQRKGYVNFGFFFGGALRDPEKLLIGDGKRLRHVKVWSVEEAKNPALAKLIAAAWEKAPESMATLRKGMKKRKA